MADIPMKSKLPTEAHLALVRELKEGLARAVAVYPHLEAQDMLACISQLAGSILALLDQRRFTPDMAMKIVASNIEVGNRTAMTEILGEGGAA